MIAMLRAALAALLLAAAPPLAAATPQETYNAAQAAFDRGDMAAARDGFTAVLAGMKNRGTRSAAIVSARLAAAEVALGWPERALPLVTAALAALPAVPAEAEERRAAQMTLARAQEALIDYPAAATAWRAAIALSQGAAAVEPELGLARVLLFADPSAARAALERARAAAAPDAAASFRAQVLTLDGRIALAAGEFDRAAQAFTAALALVGGLDTRVSVLDLAIRSDLSLTAFLRGYPTEGRRYLANSGVLQTFEKGVVAPIDQPLAHCAAAGAPGKDDVAVVEFAIADDGRVVRVTPIYAQRGPIGQPPRGSAADRAAVAAAMARTVRDWSWPPEAAKAVPAFWRAMIRIEMRCADPDGAQAITPALFAPQFDDWLKAKGVAPMPAIGGSAAARLAEERSELARRRASYGDDSLQLAPALDALVDNEAAPAAERLAWFRQLAALEERHGAPPDLQLLSRGLLAMSGDGPKGPSGDRLVTAVPGIAAPGAATSRAEAFFSYVYAAGAIDQRDDAKALPALRRIVAASPDVLADNDTIRLAAFVQLATLDAAAQRVDAARARLAEAGIDPEQCSLVHVEPVRRGGGSSSQDFPSEALGWGIQGRVRYGFDIDSSGRPVDVRAVAAMPPFVFNEAGASVVARGQYRPIFRGTAAPGCTGEFQPVVFQIPQ